MVSNFTTTRYYIHSETTEIAENLGWANNIYINPDNENLIDNIGKDIIVRGYVLKNVNQTNVGNYLTEAYLTIGTENYNIIGDGICGDLESSNPSSWNYDPQCEDDIYGLTGYAITNTNTGIIGMCLLIIFMGLIFGIYFASDTLDPKIIGITIGGIILMITFYVAVLSMFPTP